MGQNLGELVGVIFAAKENLPMEAMVPERATDVVTEKIPIKEETPKDTVVGPKDPLPPPRHYDSLVAHVRACLPWWRRHAQPSVVRIMERGVEPNWLRPPALRNPDRHVHTPQELDMTRALMNDEYMPVGAVIKLKNHTGYTVPWFLIVKDDGLGGQKVRFPACALQGIAARWLSAHYKTIARSIARAMARGLGFVTPCPNKQGKNAYFSKVSDASGTACDAVNVREDCKHFGPPLWVVRPCGRTRTFWRT